jgi:hypothetical protein
MSYTIQIGTGLQVPLADLDITAATLTEDDQAGSSLQLTVDRPIDAAAICSPFGKVTLREGTTIRWIGWLDQAPKAASGSAEQQGYTFHGPHRWLTRTILTDAGTGGIRQLAASTPDEPPLPADTVLADILDTTIDQIGTGLITYSESDLTATLLQIEIPVDRRIDNSSHTLLLAVMRFLPTFAMWWDYSSGTPTLRWTDRDSATLAGTLTETGYHIIQSTVNPRYDLLHDTTTIYWVRDNIVDATDTLASSGDAATLGANRRRVITLEANAKYAIPAAGIAESIGKYYRRLHIDAQAQLAAIDWTHRPSQRWGFGGIYATTAQAFITQIQRDLNTDYQTLTLGVPPHVILSGQTLGQKQIDSSSGGNGGNNDPQNATVTRTIQDPTSAAIPGSYYMVNGQSFASGDSGDFPPVTPLRISYFVPPDFVAPETEEISLPGNGNSDEIIGVTWRDRLRLRRADGQEGEEIDIRVPDLPADIGTAKFREITYLDPDLNIMRAWGLFTEPQNDGTVELPEGPEGPPGAPGSNGTDGTDGVDGREPTGATATCNGEGGIDITFTYAS